MMHINTHEAYKKLVDAGLKEKAAETITLVINEARKSDFDNLATKEDIANVRLEIANVRSELKEDIANVRTEIASLRTELKEEIAELRGKFGIMQWMMGFLLAMVSAVLLKLFLG